MMLCFQENVQLQTKLKMAAADVGRLTKERDKLMEISNRRKASLTKDMTEREEQHLAGPRTPIDPTSPNKPKPALNPI